MTESYNCLCLRNTIDKCLCNLDLFLKYYLNETQHCNLYTLVFVIPVSLNVVSYMPRPHNNFYNTRHSMSTLQRDKIPLWHGIIFPQISADSDKGGSRVLTQRFPKATPPLRAYRSFQIEEKHLATKRRGGISDIISKVAHFSINLIAKRNRQDNKINYQYDFSLFLIFLPMQFNGF